MLQNTIQENTNTLTHTNTAKNTQKYCQIHIILQEEKLGSMQLFGHAKGVVGACFEAMP